MSRRHSTRLFCAASAALPLMILASCSHSSAYLVDQTAVPASCSTPGATEGDPFFGCANAANLELMVADRTDLTAPAELADPQGDAAFEAARRHRQGQVKSGAGDGDYSSVEAVPEAEQ